MKSWPLFTIVVALFSLVVNSSLLLHASADALMKPSLPGLTNYWNFDSTVIDSQNVDKSINAYSTSYVTDRAGKLLSAIYLNNGYLDVSAVVDIRGSFTIAAWVNVRSRSQFGRLIDCGTRLGGSDNIVASLSLLSTGNSFVEVDWNYNKSTLFNSVQKIPIAKWTHVVFTFSDVDLYANIYTNGHLDATGRLNRPRAELKRDQCFVGKSWNANNGPSYLYIDDLMIFNRKIGQNLVSQVMQFSSYINY